MLANVLAISAQKSVSESGLVKTRGEGSERTKGIIGNRGDFVDFFFCSSRFFRLVCNGWIFVMAFCNTAVVTHVCVWGAFGW